jgi:hypothetical protein
VVHGGTDQYFYIPYSVFDRLGPERASDVLPVGTVLRKERHLNPVDKSRMGMGQNRTSMLSLDDLPECTHKKTFSIPQTGEHPKGPATRYPHWVLMAVAEGV